MTRVLVSGGTGYVGSFIVQHLLAHGHEVCVAGRKAPAQGIFGGTVGFRRLDLGEPAEPGLFEGVEWFVHAALDHVPDRYRSGEGDDPQGFRRRNLDGSVALFGLAKARGVRKAAFLSSRAVYGTQPPGMPLTEETPPDPDTLYGEVKRAAENALLGMAAGNFAPLVLRITGVYGTAPGGTDKWAELVGRFLAGHPVEPRVATEVHGRDVAAAVALLLESETQAGIFNVSDIVVDRHDMLAIARPPASALSLPARADPAMLNVMATDKLRGLGWRPGGRPLIEKSVRALARRLQRYG